MSNLVMQTASPTTTISAEKYRQQIDAIIAALDSIVLGKEQQIRLALACLLANGHLLIEDLPGMGKTTLAHALARVLGLDFHRIQFTSDMLPADVIGVSVFRKESADFQFHAGPVFAQLVLADEVNRATPKTQSALLEAMEERQVSVDGETHKLPTPFFVIATQNPQEQVGTYALPESQLDRFLMRIFLGYPDRQHERELLTGADRRQLLDALMPKVSPAELIALQNAVQHVHVSDALLDYQQNLVEFTRSDSRIASGLSPRASLVLLQAAKAWAFIHGHPGVTPADLQAVFAEVVDHRLRFRNPADNTDDEVLSSYIIRSVAIP
ncbi:MAG: MoxR family ATPase [Gammaproteobacteria bacterium]|nr:MoxR family ATPase [Gammaproteobacteria bacterium]